MAPNRAVGAGRIRLARIPLRRLNMTNVASRRRFLAAAGLGMAAAALTPRIVRAAEGRAPRILLRSSWQTVNIGDIGHTPGMLSILQEHIPEAQITLWPGKLDNGVDELLKRNFPKLSFAIKSDEVAAAIAETDFFLHGSGASLVAQKHLARFRKDQPNKPYGIYGITYSADNAEGKDIINHARFTYFRDSVSLGVAKKQGLTCPVMEFGPDAAFGVKLRNDDAAVAFLKATGLEEGKFLCCIPRLRYTPYWKVRGTAMTEEDKRKHERSEEMKEHDHAPLREAIAAVVRQTPLKVLLCPEDMSQMAIGKEMLLDKLPDDVKKGVVWREKYWLTDEALSTYVRSAGLFGLEMHSPIMCIGNGVPAIVCRFAEQTSKGIMWRDIGLGDWLFDVDQPDEVAKLVPTVLAMAQDPAAAKAKAAKARAFVEQRQREQMEVLKKNLA
jgi:hypothetical protein